MKEGLLPNDKELVEKLRNKDQEAFREFIDLNKTRVINICYSFVHNTHDAEDIAQEVFIEMYLSVAHFRGDSNINTWLYRVAVNKCLDFIRKKNRRNKAARFQSIFGLTQKEESLAKDNFHPLSIMESDEKLSIIIKAIDRLPDNQKTAITLNKFDGMSYGDVAEILSSTVSAVDSLIQRAKKNIKKFLQAEEF